MKGLNMNCRLGPFMCVCVIAELNHTQTVYITLKIVSTWKNIHKRGPKIDPCGTPLVYYW